MERCPRKHCVTLDSSHHRVIGKGVFRRKSDRKTVQRYFCKNCCRGFSGATSSHNFGQNKRHINHSIWRLLCSSVSMRRAARLLNVSRLTVERKRKFMAARCQMKNILFLDNYQCEGSKFLIQFDDLETSIHTKLKPVSVTVAVSASQRKILWFEVSTMPAKGHLARLSRKRYGFRRDARADGLRKLLEAIRPAIVTETEFASDQNPLYGPALRSCYPENRLVQHKSRRGCLTGQGELKKAEFDPIFSINHTFAMLRANMNRLVRRTWCTSKTVEGLREHLHLYVRYHNQFLT